MLLWQLLVILLSLASALSLSMSSSLLGGLSGVSRRVSITERPYIEDVLDTYSSLPDLTVLALGSSHWNPPDAALHVAQHEVFTRSTHRYGNLLGLPALRDKLKQLLQSEGVDMQNMEVAVTAGANQGFFNLALTLCDAGDHVVIVAPYYFSHQMAFQLCQANVIICPFKPESLEPNWDILSEIMAQVKPKMVVITSPNNPSGFVWNDSQIQRVINMCKDHSSWLAVDQTYHEFVFDGVAHTYPCSKRFNYDRIAHIFSLSKIFGMAGWRLGYIVYPSQISMEMRKIQDTSVTHAPMISQRLALSCLESTYDNLPHDTQNRWFEEHRSSLQRVREALWPVLEPLGTVKSNGAFYYLVPVPRHISEEEAVDVLARKYAVLLMHGTPFGAPGHLRLSYGSIPPDQVVQAIGKLQAGFEHLQQLSHQRDGQTS